MKRHGRHQSTMTIREPDMVDIEPASGIIIVGAGAFFQEISRLVRAHAEFNLLGILDPNPGLKGLKVDSLPVLGWIADIPEEVNHAVVGMPAVPGAFERDAVAQILHKRGICLPVLRSPSSRVAGDVALRMGTLLLDGCVVESGAIIGQNCMVGSGAVIESGVEIMDHSVVSPGEHLSPGSVSQAGNKTKGLAAIISSENETIQEIIRKINKSAREIMLITAADGRLSGVVTDGDIRRGILAGVNLGEPVSVIMNRKPVTVPLGASQNDMLDLMRSRSIRHIAVVDSRNRPIRLEVIQDLIKDLTSQNAIIMAGGLGMRLRPLTNTRPKTLIPVAGKPILDHVLSNLRESGLKDVVISVNYLGEQIKRHVRSGSEFDLNVNYLSEQSRMGTAGALSGLRPKPKRPFLVMNGDLLTNMDFSKLLRFQTKHGYQMVMCLKRHALKIPYGVVEVCDGNVKELREKPLHEFLINAGIYVLTPECLDMIPRNSYFDMTDLAQKIMGNGGKVGAFPIIEYWRDIGTAEDLHAVADDGEYFEMPA